MKRFVLLFFYMIATNGGYCQKESTSTIDSITKIKDYYQKKADDFIVNNIGIEAFHRYFIPHEVAFYEPRDSAFLLSKNKPDYYFMFCPYEFHQGCFICYNSKADIEYHETSFSECRVAIINYNIIIRGFQTLGKPINVIYNPSKDSCYFYNTECIPPFISNHDSINLITNEKLLEIIQKNHSKKTKMVDLTNKYYIHLEYVHEKKSYVFVFEDIIKYGTNFRRPKKTKHIIIDAYSGIVLEQYFVITNKEGTLPNVITPINKK